MLLNLEAAIRFAQSLQCDIAEFSLRLASVAQGHINQQEQAKAMDLLQLSRAEIESVLQMRMLKLCSQSALLQIAERLRQQR